MENPPIGLPPKFIWDSMRIKNILDAMKRYSEANMAIPIEWINELENLITVSDEDK